MPAKSGSQRRAAGTALAALRGEMPMSQLKGAAKDMMKSMSEEELRKMASEQMPSEGMHKMPGTKIPMKDSEMKQQKKMMKKKGKSA